MYAIAGCVVAALITITNCRIVNAGVIPNSTGTIAYISQLGGNVPHIYLANLGGTTVTQITNGPYPDNSFAWSPDGTMLALWRSDDGEAIYTINADGSDLRRLSPPAGRDIFPSWSPDGTQLVFCRVVNPGSGPPNQIINIMIMNMDGTNVQTVLANNSFNMEPRWSPDGSKILFMSTLGNNGVQIYSMGIDGSNITALTNAPYTINGDPAWSPDGSQISLGSNRSGGNVNIFTMNADGSDVQQLSPLNEPQEAQDTSWSPDGSKIAFEQNIRGGAYGEIMIINPNGTNPIRTGLFCDSTACSPRWQP